jgi:hypothetical protein
MRIFKYKNKYVGYLRIAYANKKIMCIGTSRMEVIRKFKFFYLCVLKQLEEV